MSYSHQQDKILARALHGELERFARPWYHARALRVFRDETNLAATPAAFTTIQLAMERSDWFILMASPASAASRWVAQEIGWWVSNKPRDRVLLALTDGDIRWAGQDFDWDLTTALPRLPLAGAFTSEPLWIDLRQFKPNNPTGTSAPAAIQLGDIVAEFAAPIRQREKDSLIGAHLSLGRRIRRLVTVTIIVLSLLLITASVTAYAANEQRLAAQRQARIAKAQQLAANADALLATHLDLALLLAVQAYRLDRNEQTTGALFRAATASRALVRFMPMDAQVSATAACGNSRTIVAGDSGGAVATWDVTTGKRTMLGRLDAPITSVAASADGTLVAASTERSATMWDLRNGSPVAAGQIPIPTDRQGLAVAVSPTGHFVALSSDSTPSPAAVSNASGHFVTLLNRDTSQTTTAALAVYPRFLALPSDTELAVADNAESWEHRAVPDIGHQISAGQAYTGVHGFAGTMSIDGSFFGYSNGGSTIPIWSTIGSSAHPETPDLIGASHGSDIQALAIDEDGHQIAVADAGTIYISPTDPNTVSYDQQALPGQSTISSVGFLPDGTHLVSASGTRLALWDLTQTSRIARESNLRVDYGCSACPPPRVLLSPDRAYVAVAPGDLHTVTLRALDGNDETTLDTRDVTTSYGLIGWNSDGSRWYDVSPTGEIEVRAAKPRAPLLDHWHGYSQEGILTIVPGKSQIITYTQAEIDLRDQSGKLMRKLVDIPRGAAGFSSSTDGSAIAVSTQTDVIVTDVATGRSVKVGAGPASYVGFSNGHLLIQRTSGGFEVWDEMGSHLRRATQQDDSYQSAGAFSRTPAAFGGNFLVQQRSDGSLTIFDVESGTQLGTVSLPSAVLHDKTGLAMTDDGRMLLTVTEGGPGPDSGELLQWGLTPDAWIDSACTTVGRDLTVDERETYLGPGLHTGPTCPTQPTSTATPPRGGLPSVDPVTQAEAVNKTLQQMHQQRLSIQQPIQDAATCGHLDADAQQLADTADDRSVLADTVAAMQIEQIGGGAQLKRLLVDALRISAVADSEFAAWARDLKNAGCQATSSTNDPHYAHALSLSAAAQHDKDEAVASWSPIAIRYTQQRWQASDI